MYKLLISTPPGLFTEPSNSLDYLHILVNKCVDTLLDNLSIGFFIRRKIAQTTMILPVERTRAGGKYIAAFLE